MLNSYKDEKNIPRNKNQMQNIAQNQMQKIAQNHIAQKYCKTFIKLRFSPIHRDTTFQPDRNI